MFLEEEDFKEDVLGIIISYGAILLTILGELLFNIF